MVQGATKKKKKSTHPVMDIFHCLRLSHQKQSMFHTFITRDKVQTLLPTTESLHSIDFSMQSSALLIHCLSPALHNDESCCFTLNAFSPN